jgi:heme-degrading monooxygenase HmoA
MVCTSTDVARCSWVGNLREDRDMIVCLRTVRVPAHERAPYLQWIADGRSIREEHGILAEWVLEPAVGEGDTVVVTVWPDHAMFDAWIATPARGALTASDVHQAVDYQPITRYDVVAGYTDGERLGAIDRRSKEQP